MGLIWGTVLFLLGLLGAILVPIIVRITTDDTKDWLQWITRRLVERAVSQLPEDERERRKEEWWSHINEWPGALAKLYVAYGYLYASRSITRIATTTDRIPDNAPIDRLIQRFLDLTISLTLLVWSAPLLLIIAILIKLDSPGPIFVRLNFIGQDGEIFALNFRTFDLSCEYKTRTGSILRILRLDELPLLFNIFRGDMTFVGPMPQSAQSNGGDDDAHAQAFRNRVNGKPGLISLSRVNRLLGREVTLPEEDGDKFSVRTYFGTLLLAVRAILYPVRH
jgi:lipopolysaccharide/colanic/teichoic acid biosynthesis glycosyltransferase